MENSALGWRWRIVTEYGCSNLTPSQQSIWRSCGRLPENVVHTTRKFTRPSWGRVSSPTSRLLTRQLRPHAACNLCFVERIEWPSSLSLRRERARIGDAALDPC